MSIMKLLKKAKTPTEAFILLVKDLITVEVSDDVLQAFKKLVDAECGRRVFSRKLYEHAESRTTNAQEARRLTNRLTVEMCLRHGWDVAMIGLPFPNDEVA